MPRFRRLLILLPALILLLIVLRATFVSSQTVDQLPPGFSQALSAVRGAEAAGATPAEIAPLVALLNIALQLNRQAANASSPGRSQLQAQVSSQLATVQSRAGQLQGVASQRTFTDDVISYLSGGVGAIVATVVSAYCLSFWRKYRVKRTFQMRIYKK
jgi:hypothetical protein